MLRFAALTIDPRRNWAVEPRWDEEETFAIEKAVELIGAQHPYTTSGQHIEVAGSRDDGLFTFLPLARFRDTHTFRRSLCRWRG